MSDPTNEQVGFGRPPKDHQFKSGQSGNPKGRPKGSRNLANILEEELDQKISVTDGGKRRRLSKRRLVIRQQVNRAVQGDPKAFVAITRLRQSGDPCSTQVDGMLQAHRTELSEEQYLAALLRFHNTKHKETGG